MYSEKLGPRLVILKIKTETLLYEIRHYFHFPMLIKFRQTPQTPTCLSSTLSMKMKGTSIWSTVLKLCVKTPSISSGRAWEKLSMEAVKISLRRRRWFLTIRWKIRITLLSRSSAVFRSCGRSDLQILLF